VELVLEFITRIAGTVTPRAAPLDHEVGDDPVKLEVVVEALAHQLFEIGDGLRDLVIMKLEADGSPVRNNRGDFH
jgi:hypothetical protein